MARLGARPADWLAWAQLCLRDLRPYVADPDARLTPSSKLTPASLGKVPSRYYSQGAGGIPGWQEMDAQSHDIDTWKRSPTLGLGMVCRTIKAIDIDIDDGTAADEIDDLITEITGCRLPARMRAGSERRVLLCRTQEPLRKHVIHTPAGKVELLGDRQFVALVGRHKSGDHYVFPDGAPASLDDIPFIDPGRLIEELGYEYETDSLTSIPEARDPAQVDGAHPANRFVEESSWFREYLPDGSWSVICPQHDMHESTNGTRLDPDPSTTVFFPAGLGGRSEPGFNCQHTSHGTLNIANFLNGIGYTQQEFDPIGDESDPLPEGQESSDPVDIIRRNNKTGLFPGITTNLIAMLSARAFPVHIRRDRFTDQTFIKIKDAAWTHFQDRHMGQVKEYMERFGAETVATNTLREAMGHVASENSYDSAQDWLTALRWDGTDRISRFPSRVWRIADSAYHVAVARYLFTALAGRALSPGIKADMIPVLQGRQGIRKSTFVEALAPWPEAFGVHSFTDTNADSGRMNAGKVVVEIEEMKGLRSRDEESIKAWVTQSADSWVPKFKEIPVSHPRRFVAIGTVNPQRFLNDVENRRWLPMHLDQTIDTEYVEQNITQLWAQGKVLYQQQGILWQDAEELGDQNRSMFIHMSATAQTVRRFLRDEPGEYTSYEILRICFGTSSSNANRLMTQISVAMRMLGYAENPVTEKWEFPFL